MLHMTEESSTSFACATMSGRSRRESPITSDSSENASGTAHKHSLEGRFRLNSRSRFGTPLDQAEQTNIHRYCFRTDWESDAPRLPTSVKEQSRIPSDAERPTGPGLHR